MNRKKSLDEILEITYDLVNFFFEGRVDKGGTPYIEHLEFVSGGVIGHHRIVGLLHDILEDTICTPGFLLEKGIPEEIVKSVVIITRVEGETYNQYIDRIIDSGDLAAIIIKKIDLLHNMDLTRLKDPTDRDTSRVIKRYLPAYEKIKNYLQQRGILCN